MFQILASRGHDTMFIRLADAVAEKHGTPLVDMLLSDTTPEGKGCVDLALASNVSFA